MNLQKQKASNSTTGCDDDDDDYALVTPFLLQLQNNQAINMNQKAKLLNKIKQIKILTRKDIDIDQDEQKKKTKREKDCLLFHINI